MTTKTENPRRIEIARINVSKERTWIEVKVVYEKGGMSMWDYKQRPSGYYLSVGPIERTPDGKGLIMTLVSGCRSLIEESPRFNAKRLAKLGAENGPGTPLCDQLTENILSINGFFVVSVDRMPF